MNHTIMSDASFCPQTGAAGYGFWIASARGKVAGGGPFKGILKGICAAEMRAVCNAIFYGMQMGIIYQNDYLLVQIDSMAAIHAFQGARKVRDSEELEALQWLKKVKNDNGLVISFRHVKGHTKRNKARHLANNHCDERAYAGMALRRMEIRNQGNTNA